MPVVSAQNLTRLRTTRHACKLALSVYHPATLWTAQVNGSQATGATSITVDNVVGSIPAPNCLVLFGTAAGGRDLGTARLKAYPAPILTVSPHNAALADDTYITIVEEIKPEAIHPTVSATDVVSEDGDTAYNDENLKYMPLAKMGSPAVAYIDASTGLATVKFYSRSEAFGGATLSTYAWVFPSGTPGTSATAGTAGTPVTVTWNTAGQYYVSLTVTDSNGKTHTGYRPVFIYDSSTVPYTQIEVGGLEGDAESGVWSTHLTVYGDADAAEFPANALCVLSAIDYYGAEQVSIGNETWRENIVFVGYIRRGTAKIDRLHGFVEFDVDSVSGVADNLWQIAGALATTAGTPAGWHALKNMTYNLAAHHILTQHSTLTQICDVYLNLPTYTVANFDLIDASLSENLNQIARATRGRVGCSAQGSLYLEINPQLQSLASRSVSYVLTTQNADVRDEIDLGDELQEKQTPQIDFSGEDATAAPVFSLAPSTPWTYGQNAEKVDGIRVANQTESNEFAGLFEAYRNNAFGDVVINWRGNYRVFDTFPAEPLAVTFTAAQNTRGIVWTAQRCWVKRVSYEYRPGILLASAVVEKDSYGALGVTGDYPTTEPDPTPPAPPAEPPPIPPPIPPTPTPGDGSRVYVATDVGVAISSDFLTSPTWTALNTGLSGDGLDVYEFKFDPWSSNGVTLATGFIVCKNGVWKNTGLPAGSWSQVLTSAAVQAATGDAGAVNWGRGLILPIVTQNFIGIWVNQTHAPAYRNYWLYSTDSGTTWNANTTNYVDSTTKPTTQGYFKMWDTWPSHKTAGTIYAIMATATGGGGDLNRYYKTTNNGVTWTAIKSLAFSAAGGAAEYAGNLQKSNVMPFADGSGATYANDNRCWGIHESDEIRYTTAFPAYAVFNIDDWTLSYDTNTQLTFIDMCTWDEDYIYVSSSPIASKVFYTNNGGTAWSTHTWAIANSAPYCLSALPYNALFCAVAGPASSGDGHSTVGVELTLDGGATWPDHTGDLKTVLSGIRGIRSIVPDWIKST